MNVRIPTNIGAATGEGPLANVVVTPEGYLLATDGRMAAIVETMECDGIEKLEPIPGKLAGPGNLLFANGEWRRRPATVAEGKFPKLVQVMPEVPRPHVLLALDAKRLYALAQALNYDNDPCVVLLLPVGEIPPKPLYVGSTAGAGFGLIMPAHASIPTKDFSATASRLTAMIERYKRSAAQGNPSTRDQP